MRETLRYVSTHDERGRCNYDALSLAQDGIDSLPGNVRVVAMIGDRAEVLVVTDLTSDSRARELVTSAALACGRRMP